MNSIYYQMGLGKLWNRTKAWGASGWKRAKHFGAQGLNKAASLYDRFDNATGGNAASMIGQGVGAIASLHPWSNAIAKFAGAGIGALGGMMSDDSKWKRHVTNFGKGLSLMPGAKDDAPTQTVPSVKKRPVTNNGNGNSWVRYGTNRLM